MRTLYTCTIALGIFLATQVAFVHAEQVTTYKASSLQAHSQITFSPQNASFLDGSTFEIPIYLNTLGRSVNAVDLSIKFDPGVLSIVNPSGGKSIIGVWVEPPSYDNTRGTARIVGTIPNGIVTDSGLLITLIFRAKSSGRATVSIADTSQVLLNDGLGTATILDSTRGTYTITPKPPEGVTVYSDTHPFQDKWYNNNSPVLTWDKEPGVSGFSFVLDNKPTTIPESKVATEETTKSYTNLAEGLWYFHIKALKQGVWGNTTHFVLKMDTSQPAEFKPKLEFLGAAVINRFLVSFFTSDALSGIDHYEVGVIDKAAAVTASPVFVQTESPYQLPFDNLDHAHIIVRAFDRAGNIRDAAVDAEVPFVPLKILTDNAVLILSTILLLIIIIFIIHYFYGHKIIRRIDQNLSNNNPPPNSP